MRKIIAIGGEPGTGKTTLMRELMNPYTWEAAEPVKLVSCMYSRAPEMYVLGKYEKGEVFAGTDRLSMAVQPAAREMILSTNCDILFEGDRLFNQSFLEFLAELPDTELRILYLKAEDDVLQQRYASRGSNQDPTFLKGRRTKYENLLSNFMLMGYTHVMRNMTSDDMMDAIQQIRGWLGHDFDFVIPETT